MNTLKISLAALVVLTAAGAAPAFAAVATDSEFSPDGVDVRECKFVADTGGYVCEQLDGGYSLSELSDGPQKKKIKLIWNPNLGFPKL